MTDPDAVDLALFVFRCGIGAIMLAHGINHVFTGTEITIDGTAGWFGSMGMRWPTFQAWAASLTEIGAGALLLVGFLTPLAAGGVIGVMTVAWLIAHRTNGFFIFNEGQGWEYVMTLLLCGVVLATLGPGGWSLDEAVDVVDDLSGWTGLAIALGAGIGGALVLLAISWRPPPSERT